MSTNRHVTGKWHLFTTVRNCGILKERFLGVRHLHMSSGYYSILCIFCIISASSLSTNFPTFAATISHQRWLTFRTFFWWISRRLSALQVSIVCGYCHRSRHRLRFVNNRRSSGWLHRQSVSTSCGFYSNTSCCHCCHHINQRLHQWHFYCCFQICLTGIFLRLLEVRLGRAPKGLSINYLWRLIVQDFLQARCHYCHPSLSVTTLKQ